MLTKNSVVIGKASILSGDVIERANIAPVPIRLCFPSQLESPLRKEYRVIDEAVIAVMQYCTTVMQQQTL